MLQLYIVSFTFNVSKDNPLKRKTAKRPRIEQKGHSSSLQRINGSFCPLLLEQGGLLDFDLVMIPVIVEGFLVIDLTMRHEDSTDSK